MHCADNPASSFPGRFRTRRQWLAGGVAALATPAIVPGRAYAGDRLVVVNFGGAIGEAKQRAVYTPFTRETGIEIVVVSGPDLAKIRAQVRSRDVEWDVTDLLDGWVPVASRMGLLERLDDRVVDRTGCLPQARHDYAVAGSLYTGGIAYPTDRLVGKAPGTWPEFWDFSKFPGRRGLRNRVTDMIEIALMADGVPAREVYPCDVDRAFRALDRIKPHVSHWIAATAQTVTLIQANETDFTYTYNVRVKDMQSAGVPIGYSFRQNLLGFGWAGVVKGTPRREAAMRLCGFIARPDVQVALANLAVTAPCYPDAVSHVDPAVRRWLPDLGSPDNLFIDASWWDGRLEDLTQRFQSWLLA